MPMMPFEDSKVREQNQKHEAVVGKQAQGHAVMSQVFAPSSPTLPVKGPSADTAIIRNAGTCPARNQIIPGRKTLNGGDCNQRDASAQR
jgi:hypothetical protein